jgi:hypothetical protein
VTDGDRLRLGLGFLLGAFVGGLAAEAAVGAMVVVVVLPFMELVVEDLGVVADDAVEHPVKLLSVDPVGPLDLAVKAAGYGV